MDDDVDKECGYPKKKVIYDLFGVINFIVSIEFVLMRYEYKDTEVNIFGDKIFNFNDVYRLFYKIQKN